MTTPTEEERKAAAEKLQERHNINFTSRHKFTVEHDLMCELTHTEKRLEVAEGLLRRASRTCHPFSKEDINAYFNPPAEGE